MKYHPIRGPAGTGPAFLVKGCTYKIQVSAIVFAVGRSRSVAVGFGRPTEKRPLVQFSPVITVKRNLKILVTFAQIRCMGH